MPSDREVSETAAKLSPGGRDRGVRESEGTGYGTESVSGYRDPLPGEEELMVSREVSETLPVFLEEGKEDV
jgi:hypothetical protein